MKGIKVVYPSNAADMKGLMKAAFYDPNPVVMLEHKGLYWGKVPGTAEAKNPEPSRDYIIPLGKANIVQEANADKINNGESCCIVTYGMGVYWAKAAAVQFPGQVAIIDLRTLFPLDENLIFETVTKAWKMPGVNRRAAKQFFCGSTGGQDIQTLFPLFRPAGRSTRCIEQSCRSPEHRTGKSHAAQCRKSGGYT